jgi:hypothetical protein
MMFFGYWIYDIYVLRPAAIEEIEEEAEQPNENMCLRGEPFLNGDVWQCIDNSDNILQPLSR